MSRSISWWRWGWRWWGVCVFVYSSVEVFFVCSCAAPLFKPFEHHYDLPPDNPCQHVCKLSINRSALFITQSVCPFILNHHHFRFVFNFLFTDLKIRLRDKNNVVNNLCSILITTYISLKSNIYFSRDAGMCCCQWQKKSIILLCTAWHIFVLCQRHWKLTVCVCVFACFDACVLSSPHLYTNTYRCIGMAKI